MAESRGSLSDSDGFKNNIVSALQLAKAELETKHEKANFIRIIMRFPKIRAVFEPFKLGEVSNEFVDILIKTHHISHT